MKTHFWRVAVLALSLAAPGCDGNPTSSASAVAQISGAQLVTYSAPSGIPASPQYSVQLAQNGTASPSFVYQDQNPAYLANEGAYYQAGPELQPELPNGWSLVAN